MCLGEGLGGRLWRDWMRTQGPRETEDALGARKQMEGLALEGEASRAGVEGMETDAHVNKERFTRRALASLFAGRQHDVCRVRRKRALSGSGAARREQAKKPEQLWQVAEGLPPPPEHWY